MRIEHTGNDEIPYVNAYINNISFPTSIEELETFINEHGMYNVEEVLCYPEVCWTVPRSSKIGDIVLFYHAKTAISRITALAAKVKMLPDGSDHSKTLLMDWLERARGLFKMYGGKVFAVARITGSPEYWKTEDNAANPYHWHGRIYADVGDIVVLDSPVDIHEFNSFIKVSRQSAITPLPAAEFNKLRCIIQSRNENLPNYFLRCQIGCYSLSHINRDNFLAVTQMYRRRFLLEIDFRSYYVDYLLKSLVGHQFWQECRCHTEGKPNCFVDNVFKFANQYFLLEVKLNIQMEKNLSGQLRQYINADHIYLEKGTLKEEITDFERKYMYVIDTNAFYRYDAATDQLIELVRLDYVTSVNEIKQII